MTTNVVKDMMKGEMKGCIFSLKSAALYCNIYTMFIDTVTFKCQEHLDWILS